MSLPKDKKDKLSEQVQKDLEDTFQRHQRNLRKHEVSREDTREIVTGAVKRFSSSNYEEID